MEKIMNYKKNKSVISILCVIMMLVAMIQGTYAWVHMSQDANGALMYIRDTFPVELVKYERQADGTYTEIPMEDIGFGLFTEDGEQVDEIFYTDEDGYIRTDLPIGNYYWEEIYYKYGWGNDIDEDGNEILTYPFEVTDEITDEEPLLVTAYNLPMDSDLEVEKIVENLDGTELTDRQLETEFEFYVYFSDGGTYEYYITQRDEDGNIIEKDEAEYLTVTSEETFLLKHGEVAVFKDLPMGLIYSVHESRQINYYTTSEGHMGNVAYGETLAEFTNIYDPIYGSILVTKEVEGEDADLDKEFEFTVIIDGVEQTFTLKHGEEWLIEEIPVGTPYYVKEKDYLDEEYYATILIYEGEILGEYEHVLPFVNVYDPAEELGDLFVRKELTGNEENFDLDLEFEFEIVLSYEGVITLEETFTLKADQLGDPNLWKFFEQYPVGTYYSIKETNSHGYWPESDHIEGYITGKNFDADADYSTEEDEDDDNDNDSDILVGYEDLQILTFYNMVPEMKNLEITKIVTGNQPEWDLDKEFEIKLYIDGELFEEFTLTAGEMKSFEVPQYCTYEVWEADYIDDGYSQKIIAGYGTIWEDLTECYIINDYVLSEEEITGVKTWSTAVEAQEFIPEYIIVRLLTDDYVVEEIIVRPNEDGEWLYTFTAPTYDKNGDVIEYYIEEEPLEYFYPIYDGYDIYNEYVESITVILPVLEKQIIGLDLTSEKFYFVLKGLDGAPMPTGSVGDEFIYAQYGAGEQELGEIRFNTPGTYYYTIKETLGASLGWIYDENVYSLVITVEEIGNELTATYQLFLDDVECERAVFVNEFDEDLIDDDEELPEDEDDEDDEDDDLLDDDLDDEEDDLDDEDDDKLNETIVVSGKKTWNHGLNSVEHQPKELVIYLLANSDVYYIVSISNETNWSYSFTVPKYNADGSLAVYEIREEFVEGYIGEVVGYNLINTYNYDKLVEDGGGSDSSGGHNASPQTGDYTDIWFWVATLIISFVTFCFVNRKSNKRKIRNWN